jgi:DNA-binding beta-propeller fold protein YncE
MFLNIHGKYVQIFSDIRSLAVNSHGNKIYVADYERGLIILDRNLKLLSQFNDPTTLQAANGVCQYKTGSVLVCGRESSNVLLINPKGKLLAESLKAFKVCQAICCKDNQNLIIGFQSSDEIKVYDIIE